jgi:5S rRNA maturation endonuclease (ribonuclease M5)
MTENTHVPCPFCDSSNAFSYNDENGMFKCYSCGAVPSEHNCRVFDGVTKTPNTNDYNKMEPQGMSLEPYIPEEGYRGIIKSVLEKFGVYFTKMPDSDVATVHYTYENGTKHRTLPKSIKTSGKMDRFYGQDDYTAGTTITITEGEEDRLSVIQMMGDWPTVSVPGANPSKDFWESARNYLKNFKEIVLSVDNDVYGDELADKFYRMFPGKVYRVNHGKYKDANGFLADSAKDQYKAAWWAKVRIKPDNINSTAKDFLRVYDETPNYEYFATDIPELDEKMLGIHKSAFTLILAPTGIGKTELVRYFEKKCYDAGKVFAFCHGEETELRSLLGLVSYELGYNVTRKDLIDALGLDQEVRDCLTKLGASEQLNQFTIRVGETIEDIVEQVRFLAVAMGAEYIFIEPIQDFVSGTTTEKENQLTNLANTLKRLAAELNVGIIAIAHANEDGDAKYCKSLTQSAAYEITLEREVNSDDPDEQNRTYLFVGRKNRTGGGSGPAGILGFDRSSYSLAPEKDFTPVIDRGNVVTSLVKPNGTDSSQKF